MSKYKDPATYKYAPIDAGVFFFPTDDGCSVVVTIEDGSPELWRSDFFLNMEELYSFNFERKCEEQKDTIEDCTCHSIFKIVSLNIATKGALGVHYHSWKNDPEYEEFYTHFYDTLEEMLPEFEFFDITWIDDEVQKQSTLVVHKDNLDKDTIVNEWTKYIQYPDS